ncbi:DHS-like NAD/FAD-binding domain-containing protein [Hymenopellis radicata]|nr:DHS-like NAD/FAD-binding domain-containing protein [Hymenopellis radicata]
MIISLDLNDGPADGSAARQLDDISACVWKSKRIVVVTGAGVSCSALKKSIDVSEPTPTHLFLKRLDSKHKLLRVYTQNIDGLEERAGLAIATGPEGRQKQPHRSAHGDIHHLRCVLCSGDIVCSVEHIELFQAGLAPPCPDCTQRSEARTARSSRATTIGNLRPAVVLYNEPHPHGDFIAAIQASDIRKKPDMLLIMGTSLKVHGLKKLVKDLANAVHMQAANTKRRTLCVVFVNRTPPGKEWEGIIDCHVSGDSDKWVSLVEQDWAKRRPADWQVQARLDNDNSPAALRVVKDMRQRALPRKV